MTTISIEPPPKLTLGNITQDLRKFSRGSDKTCTTIRVTPDAGYGGTVDWLTLGQISLNRHDKLRYWTLKSFINNDTDFDHDTAQIVNFQIIGCEFEFMSCGVSYFQGYIGGPGGLKDAGFNVPPVGYNPYDNPGRDGKGVVNCPTCKGQDKHKTGLRYVPGNNQELYELLRGSLVNICTGPVNDG